MLLGSGCGNGLITFSVSASVPTPTAIPTPTSTPSPTPTQGPWKKLKDTSFQSSNSLDFTIPSAPLAFDSDDTGGSAGSYFIVDNGGVVSNNSYLFNSSQTSSNQWSITGYSPTVGLDKNQFESYAKSRKQITNISNPNLTDLVDKSINIYSSDLTINDTNKGSFDNKTLVLIVDGTVAFDINGKFQPSNASVAILANTINFYNGSNFISTANGIFIADNVNTGTSSTGLKIKGNLVVKTTFNNQREQTDNRKPSVFVVVNPQTYLDLLPYLSVSQYKWQQLE
jgi:hypothetical protein